MIWRYKMAQLEKATFAGGCFWCMVKPFDHYNGVEQVVAGYTGGHTINPTYEQVCRGDTGHTEAIEITFDPTKISYTELLDIFWRQIDPTDGHGQFADRGDSYRPAIFYHSQEQLEQALASKKALAESELFTQPIKVSIEPAAIFYPAETYHQQFYQKQPEHYQRYTQLSGRASFLQQQWPEEKTRENTIKQQRLQQLTPMQYKVTQENGTEPPFENAFYQQEAEGLYVDIVSGEALFTSKDKFDSGCGWPSFSKPIEQTNIIEKSDLSHGMQRVEVRSSSADSHLGHVFTDGPKQLGGLRYCINSASLRFIPKEKLLEEGYGNYLSLFD